MSFVQSTRRQRWSNWGQKKSQSVTYRAVTNGLIVVEGLKDSKVNIARLVAQKIWATGVPRVEIGEETLELLDMSVLVIRGLGGQLGNPASLALWSAEIIHPWNDTSGGKVDDGGSAGFSGMSDCTYPPIIVDVSYGIDKILFVV